MKGCDRREVKTIDSGDFGHEIGEITRKRGQMSRAEGKSSGMITTNTFAVSNVPSTVDIKQYRRLRDIKGPYLETCRNLGS